jgi:hypothetical protein
LKLTFEVLCEMMDYRSLSHYLARKLSPERLAKLTPAERAERMLAQKRLSKARSRAKPPFAYPVIELPPPRSPYRDWLALEDNSRDIIRITPAHDRQPHQPRDE